MFDPKLDTDDVVLVYMEVCVYGEVPPEQVESRANALNRVGTSGWYVIGPDHPDSRLAGLSVPSACLDRPERVHYVLERR